MTDFTVLDVTGSLIAVAVFAVVLLAPGYAVGYASNLFGFRGLGRMERALWSNAYSFGVMPLGAYLVCRFAGLAVGSWVAVGLAAVVVLLAWTQRGRAAGWGRGGALAGTAVGVWIGVAVASLVDVQVGHRLYFSVVEFDQSYRVAFTDAVLRTGVPPTNPLYFAGHGAPLRYYYFWYVLCAMVAKIAHVTARQAFVASTVWAGLGLAGMVALCVRHFLAIPGRRGTAIAVGLLGVMGADLLPALGSVLRGEPLHGEMEWWSVDPFCSWQGAVLWVPHHTASLLCCLLSFLLIWRTRGEVSGRDRVGAVLLSSVAFASSVGLSIYVAFGFTLSMAAWTARLAVRGERGTAWRMVLAGVLGGLWLLPFLRELSDERSRTAAGQAATATHVFSFSVRRIIDPELLTGLGMFAGWKQAHPGLLDTVARLVLLLPGLVLELGFYGAVFVLLLLARRGRAEGGDARAEARSTALFLSGWGLAMVVFLRSAVIENNDFGYRGAMLPQMFLLLLGADLLASWWSGHAEAAWVTKTRGRAVLLYGLLVLGVAGTVYQGAMLRGFLPLQARQASGFKALPAEVYQARVAFGMLDRVAAKSAVVAFNPEDLGGSASGEVIAPHTFYLRSLMMNAGRQILSAEPGCATAFGGEEGACAAIREATARMYADPSPSAEAARGFCGRFGVDYLAISAMDPAWKDAAGWSGALPRVASEAGFRILKCSP
jgi:hypothetical protein